jgi:2-iminobutanoate/2-iminopropanoate deaminase
MKIIETKNAPAAIGPYVQARLAGNLLFTSGQLGIDPQTSAFSGADVASQTKQALSNLEAILKEAGLNKDNVIKVTIFMADMNDFSIVNDIYAHFWGAHKPARSTVEVARLPLDGKIEMEAIAVCG